MDPNPRARELRHEVAEARDHLDQSLAALAAASRPRVVAERAAASVEVHARAALATASHKAQEWWSQNGASNRAVLIGSEQPPAVDARVVVGVMIAATLLLVWGRRRRRRR